MASIQFKGVDSVIEAYENREVAPWSIWQGKQFMFKYEGNNVAEGAQQLTATLELLKESSNAIYTLKVYEDLKGGKIKSNTADDGSFNFKLNGDEQTITQNQYASLKYNDKLSERLERIEQALLEREDEEPEPENKLGVIGEIISHPTIAPIVQNIVAAIFSKGQSPAQTPRVALSGVNDESELKEAVEALKKHDSKLTEHLQKLAALAEQSPESFKFLLTTLDNM